MTAAGEWLPAWLRTDVVDQADDGADAPPPAPAPSLVSGAIGRSMADARERYRQQLVDQWHALDERLHSPTVHACTDDDVGPEGRMGRSPQ